MQAALHQSSALPATSSTALAAAARVGHVDDRPAGEIDAVLRRDLLDPARRPDQRRLDQARLGGLHRAAQRALVAG